MSPTAGCFEREEFPEIGYPDIKVSSITSEAFSIGRHLCEEAVEGAAGIIIKILLCEKCAKSYNLACYCLFIGDVNLKLIYVYTIF